MRLFARSLGLLTIAASALSAANIPLLSFINQSIHQTYAGTLISPLEPAREETGSIVVNMADTLVRSSLAATGDGTVTIGGELRLWHRVDLHLAAVDSSETANPNPFLDYRFNVTFTSPTGKKLVVPGYFNTNGNGGNAGNLWTAHLNPNETGTWTYVVSFRSGVNVAVDLATAPGTAVSPFNGKSGSFVIAASNKSGDDFRATDKGMLVNRGNHYLTYGSNGKPFVYTGPGIPENILGFRGFTNTTVGIGHTFTNHIQHWKTGDPDWDNGAAKGLIGAINYIAQEGGNSIYMMSNTIGGDGKDVFPHPTESSTKSRYDLLKLQQWDIALSHAQKKGIFLHWHLAENEASNYTYYGGNSSSGSLSTDRKLSFRMLNARFGHYNGLKWNLMEEVEWTAGELTKQMDYMKAVDPYDHPVTFQTGGAGLPYSSYDVHLGKDHLDAASFQGSPSRGDMFDTINSWRVKSANAGKPITCAWDEPQKIENDNTDTVNGYPMGRRDKMWPCLMGGGDGFMWYIQADGGGHGFDQRIEDFSIMKNAFNWSRHIRTFLSPLSLNSMVPSRTIVTSATGEDYTLYQSGQTYAIFNDRAGKDMTLNLNGISGTFNIRWFNPRSGGALQTGSVATISGGGNRALGNAPSDTGNDWAVLVTKVTTGGNLSPVANAGADKSVNDSDGNGSQAVALDGSASSDSDGTISSYVWKEGSAQLATGNKPTVTLAVGSHTITLTVTDNNGAISSDTVVVTVTPQSSSTSFTITLINADNEQIIASFDPIVNNAIIALSSLPTANVNIRANVSGVGSVKFTWSGAESGTATESAAPYAMKGDTSGNYKAWVPTLGNYTVVVTAYSGSGATGSVLQTATFKFSVTDPAPAIAGSGG